MSQNKKIVLFIVLPLFAFACLCCVVGVAVVPGLISNAVGISPEKAHQVGAQIGDYTVPPGYQEIMGMDLVMEQLVMIVPANQFSGTSTYTNVGMTIMLMQFRTVTYNREQMQQQMQQAFKNQYSGTMQYVGDRTVTIKGQPTVLTLSESTTTPGSKIRQAIGTFTGKNGMVMVMVTGADSQWDWELLDGFFESIR